MGTIVAIGGGELRDLETLEFDRKIVKLTGKRHPVALFVPTASGDAEGYWETFQNVYGKRLGCKTKVLFLIREKQTKAGIKKAIFCADLIYVGGGDTVRLFKTWKKFGVGDLLKIAFKRGIILSGLSAGAICWFKQGFSDSVKGQKGHFGFVNGLGIIDAVCCPHFNNKKRANAFRKAMKNKKELGIGIEDKSAIFFEKEQ